MERTSNGAAPRAPRIAAWSVHHSWKAMGAWVLFVVACLAVGFGVAGVREVDASTGGIGDSGKADKQIAAAFSTPYIDEQILVARATGGAISRAAVAPVVNRVRQTLTKLPGVERVGLPILSADQTTALVQVRLNDTKGEAIDNVPAVREAVAAIDGAFPAFTVKQTGEASIIAGLDDSVGKDFARAEKLSLPITFAILIVVFGAVVAAFLPLALALAAIAAAVGIAAIASHLVPQSQGLTTMILLIGIAVGVDYALFMLRRSRDERHGGAGVRESVLIASATSGRAVIISGVTVIVAMLGLMILREPTFSSMGLGAILVVATAVLGSLTALPAALSLLGDRVEKLRVPWLSRRRDANSGRIWSAIATRTVRRPVLAFALSAGLLVGLAIPALGMETRLPSLKDLPRSIPAMQTFDVLQEKFPQEGAQHLIVLTPKAGLTMSSPTVTQQIANLTTVAAKGGLAAPTDGALTISKDGRVGVLAFGSGRDETSPQTVAQLQTLRDYWIPQTIGTVGTAYVTGVAAGSQDFTELIRSNLPLVIGFVVLFTFIVMLISFRSPLIAVATVALNLLSVAAAYGLLVAIFQTHRFDNILGITTNGAIVAWVPLFLFVILFGLSMDYHVFVLSRIREERRAGASVSNAIVHGVGKTGGVVTSAAVVMVAAFAIFATLSTLEMKQLGIGLAAAILIDATVVRGVLLPATLRLLGARAWAPARRRALAPAADRA